MRRPKPPAPAFEQVIQGRPWNPLTGDRLLYLPRNPRPHKASGFGPVEQLVMTVTLMGWVKRLIDHVIQERMGHGDLEFAWIDLRPADPAEQAKMLDLYVRNGIYTVNEARGILGFDPVAGESALVYGSRGAVPLAAPAAAAAKRAAAAFARAGFNPDEPRVPAGNPDGGQWTGGGDGSAAETNPLLVAYPGDYHDAVAKALKDYLTANGGKVITGVTLNAINGTSAVADMMVRLPGAAPFIVEVKTGPGAQFTDPQRIVYPMAQVGGHVSSPNGALNDIGLSPGQLLPPLKVYVYWVINPGDSGEFIELPPPEVLP